MAAIRLGAAQSALLEKPEFLLDLLGFYLSGESGQCSNIFGIQQHRPDITPGAAGEYTPDARLTDDNPDAVFSVSDPASAFEAFRAKGKKARNAEISKGFACLFQAQTPEFMAAIESATGAGVRKHWTPTAGNYFGRVPAHVLDGYWIEFLDLAADHPAATSFAKLKKAEKAARLEALFADADIQNAHKLTPAQRACLAAWVPVFP